MTEKTIFLPPNFLFYPAATESSPSSIQLGALISNIKDPKHAIGTLPPLDMSTYNMPIVTLNAGSMDHADNSSSSVSANALVQAIELMSARFNVQFDKAKKLLSAMEEIKTEEFDPKDSYVKASLEQAGVKTWLNEKNAMGIPKWPKRRVFMVCGILIAKPMGSSKVDISRKQDQQLSGDVKADGATASSPVGGGGGGEATFQEEFGLSFVPKSPFIYGFRLRECFLSKKDQASSVPYTKGSKMHSGTTATSDPEETSEDSKFEFLGVAQQDLDFDSLGEMEDDFADPHAGDHEGSGLGYVMIVPRAN